MSDEQQAQWEAEAEEEARAADEQGRAESELAAPDGYAAKCEWWLTENKQCGKRAGYRVKYPAWSKQVPMCKPHAVEAEKWCKGTTWREVATKSAS